MTKMSNGGKSIQEMGFDSLTNRFKDALSCRSNGGNDRSDNKPDFKELDLGHLFRRERERVRRSE